MGGMGFWQELKRRHVYRVAAACVVVGWLLIQAVNQIFPVFHLPDWIAQAVVLVILVGFPVALVLAWAFDATPHGIVRTDALPAGGDAGAQPRARSRRAGIAVGLIGVMIALMAGGAYRQFARRNPPRCGSAPCARPNAQAQDRSPGSPFPAQAEPAQAIPIPARSVAVLPFEDLSADKDNACFAAGMQGLILTAHFEMAASQGANR